MHDQKSMPLSIAERVWTVEDKELAAAKNHSIEGFRSIPLGKRVLVFDTETTIDRFQELKFGSFRLYRDNLLRQEGLISSANLTEIEREVLNQYSTGNNLKIYPAKVFIEKILVPEAYYLGTLCVGFNLPFDLSRLAIRCTEGRKHWKDGFTLILTDNIFFPRIRIKSLNSKASFIEFAKPFKYEKKASHIKGNFLDLRTFGWALTNAGLSLSLACERFAVEHGKGETDEHGKVTPEYIDYNRSDVLATWEVYLKMMEEFNKHPIGLLPTKAFSPASIGKAYLKAMGIESLIKKQPVFSNEVLGQAMASYYGGRAEVKARKISVPITYLDVLSMYPSVFILQDLWRIVIAEELETVESTEAVQKFLEGITVDGLFQKENWLSMPALVEVLPENDILPVRAKYEPGGDFQIGINYISSSKPSWYTLADVVASKLLTGKIPKALRAYRIVPIGIQEGLKDVLLGGEVYVDPQKDDFFKLLIEKRKEIQLEAKSCPDPAKMQRLESLQLFLKILANSTSYGIFAEFNRKDQEGSRVEVYGTEQFSASVDFIEEPGPFANPLIATVITGAARLILAMIEVLAGKEGASYAFCDTDSMAIIGEDTTTAEKIVERFKALCPYKFGGSLLKIEDENYLEGTKIREPLYCYGISAKRYVLFNLRDGKPIIRKCSEHGLGHLISPDNKPGNHWIEKLWNYILSKHLGIEAVEPPWLNCPALGRLSITRPTFIRSLGSNNKPKQIRPFNFMLVAFPDGQAFPYSSCNKTGTLLACCPTSHKNCPNHKNCAILKKARPAAPYEKTPSKWVALPWVDLSTGNPLKLDFGREASNIAGRIHIKTYRDVLSEYEYHREVKAAGPDGMQCEKQMIGLLQRLHVEAISKIFIGKESNKLDEVEVLGLDEEAYTVYNQDWSNIVEELKRFTAAELANKTGISIRGIKRLRSGKVKPHPRNEALIREAILRRTVKNLEE